MNLEIGSLSMPCDDCSSCGSLSMSCDNVIEYFLEKQVLAATQTPGERGKKWFQGTADAVRQFIWVFEVGAYGFAYSKSSLE